MDEHDRYVFDTQGYVVLPDLLTHSEVERLVDAFPRDENGQVMLEAPDDNSHHDLLEWSEPLTRELIAHPRVLPYLKSLLTRSEEDYTGQHRFYLAHEYTMYLRSGGRGPTFHDGGTPFDPVHAYQVRDGQIFCGLLTVIWLLNDVGAGDGGFWCIPGSHKADFPMPSGLTDYSWVPDCAVQPVAPKGSAILFTEALVHGTRPWTASQDRYVLFYKYVPGYMSGIRDIRPERLRHLSTEQRLYVEP